MSKKKTNLGKAIHGFKNMDEIYDSVWKDASSFEKEVNAILDQFDPYNPYDVAVLETLLAQIMSSLSVGLESEYPEFEKCVLEMTHGLKDDCRANLLKMVENGKIKAYNKTLQKRRTQRLLEDLKD